MLSGLDRLLNSERTGLKLRGISNSLIADPFSHDPGSLSAQGLRFVGQWPCGLNPTVGLDVTVAGKLILRDDPSCSKMVLGHSFLFHSGGVTPVEVHIPIHPIHFIVLMQLWS